MMGMFLLFRCEDWEDKAEIHWTKTKFGTAHIQNIKIVTKICPLWVHKIYIKAAERGKGEGKKKTEGHKDKK